MQRDNFLSGEDVCEPTQEMGRFRFQKKDRPMTGSRGEVEDADEDK
jgi:hypothetical protein